jgi:hypothetical protein
MGLAMTGITLAAYVSLSISLAVSGSGQPPIDITWKDARLSVRAVDAPRDRVLGEVVRLTGIKIIGAENLIGRLSIDFSDLPLEKALLPLLAGLNYSIAQPVSTKSGPGQLVVRVVSGRGTPRPGDAADSPIVIPALDAIVVAEKAEELEEKAEENEDPESDDENREEKAEADRLAQEGRFAPTVPATSLIKYMESDNDHVRLAALSALATRPMTEALRPLLKALGDDAWEVRMAAIESLGRARDLESLRAVGRLLELDLANDVDRDLRINALRVLALRAQPESAAHLRAVLKDSDVFIRDVADQMLAEFDRRARVRATGRE